MGRVRLSFIIYDKFKELLRKKINEPLFLEIINSSKYIFKEKYEINNNQNNGESDYIGLLTKNGLDLKILFSTEICEILSKWPNDINAFFDKLKNDEEKLYISIMNKDNELVRKSMIYTEILRRVEEKKKYSDYIVFAPIFMTPLTDIEGALSSHLAADSFDIVINTMIKSDFEKIKDKKIYIVFPTIENKVIVKYLFDGKKNPHIKEFIKTNLIKDYISVTTIHE